MTGHAPTDWDPDPRDRRPFRLDAWITAHRHELVPPVANRQVFRQADMIVMVVGGGNQRNDFHDDPREEFFHQIRGDMDLVIWPTEGEEPFHMPIREGEVYLLPAGVRHSPQRPDPDSVGLVVEYQRPLGELDGFEWVCFECAHLVHRVEIQVQAIDRDLPPLFAAFDADEEVRTCPNCGAVHPGTGARL
ncbi:MAG: 3-hydroxyanthranilate 3,4-dioxygenase [Acidimicrobiaceae bacterium]|nr:3-hydroxyanthranilate 3,4-dioxygenase [Acidimicrobiaceae bacterium]